MQYTPVHLRQFVQESLHPRNLAGRQIAAEEFRKWKIFLDDEIAKVYSQAQAILAMPRNCRETSLQDLVIEITQLSNIVNSYLTRFTKSWGYGQSSGEIKAHYIYTLDKFEMLMLGLIKKQPKLSGKTYFTDFALRLKIPELRERSIALQKHLAGQPVGYELPNVLADAVDHLISQRKISRNEDSYLHRLMAILNRKDLADEAELIDFLIINDFNMPEFFLFCVARWNMQLTNLDGLYEQKELLLEEKSHLYDLSISAGLKNPLAKHRLYKELNAFLSEKYAIVKERVKLSRQWNDEAANSSRARRFLINLSVAQLGLFIRLQIEKGFLGKEHVGELFAFYARHFYTPKTEFMSAESLQKKSSVIEHATARKMKSHLISMLNWLNTNYNLSNFN